MGWWLPQWWIRHKGGDELLNFDLEFFLAGKLLEQNIELVRCYIANELYTVVVTRLFLIAGFHPMICWNVIWGSDDHNQVITKTQFMFYKNDGEDNLRFLYWICDVCVLKSFGGNKNSLSAVAKAHVVALIIPRVNFHVWDPYYNNSPSMYNFIKMHSCDIIQLFELDLYKFNEFDPWPISLLKFLIVPFESHPCNSTHPHDQSHLDGQFDLWT